MASLQSLPRPTTNFIRIRSSGVGMGILTPCHDTSLLRETASKSKTESPIRQSTQVWPIRKRRAPYLRASSTCSLIARTAPAFLIPDRNTGRSVNSMKRSISTSAVKRGSPRMPADIPPITRYVELNRSRARKSLFESPPIIFLPLNSGPGGEASAFLKVQTREVPFLKGQ